MSRLLARKARERKREALRQFVQRGASDASQITAGGSLGSIENPAYPLNGRNLSAWADGTWGNLALGDGVNEASAMRYATFLACVKILAESIAVLPCHVYDRKDDGSRERTGGTVEDLIHKEANPEMSAATFKETLQHHLVTWGNAYARIEFDEMQQPKALWPLHPSEVTPSRRDNGALVYVVDPAKGEKYTLNPDELLHVPGLSDNGVVGYSPIRLFRMSLEVGMATEQFAKSALENGAWSATALKHPELLDEEAYQRLRSDFHNRQGGVMNALKPMILEEGLDIQQITMPTDDAMFITLRKFEKRELAAIHRIPPHMLADLEGGASFASIEQMSIDFIRYTLKIWLVKWERELTRKLLSGTNFAEFNADAFMRGETKARYEAYKIGRDGGWLSVNEVRSLENMPPIENGDVYLQPMNMTEPTKDGANPPADATPEDPRSDVLRDVAGETIERTRGLMADVIGRLVTTERSRVQRIVSKDTPTDQKAASVRSFYEGREASLLGGVRSHAASMVAVAMKASNQNGEAPEVVADRLSTDAITNDIRAAVEELTAMIEAERDPMDALTLSGVRAVALSTRIADSVRDKYGIGGKDDG